VSLVRLRAIQIWLATLLQCFDTAGSVIRLAKYYVKGRQFVTPCDWKLLRSVADLIIMMSQDVDNHAVWAFWTTSQHGFPRGKCQLTMCVGVIQFLDIYPHICAVYITTVEHIESRSVVSWQHSLVVIWLCQKLFVECSFVLLMTLSSSESRRRVVWQSVLVFDQIGCHLMSSSDSALCVPSACLCVIYIVSSGLFWTFPTTVVNFKQSFTQIFCVEIYTELQILFT